MDRGGLAPLRGPQIATIHRRNGSQSSLTIVPIACVSASTAPTTVVIVSTSGFTVEAHEIADRDTRRTPADGSYAVPEE